jgi:hypothetical protein
MADKVKLLTETQLPSDCGDNSCIFATRKGGMRTNGGCRCAKTMPTHRVAQYVALARWAAKAHAVLKRYDHFPSAQALLAEIEE